jgi:hypothetical protein
MLSANQLASLFRWLCVGLNFVIDGKAFAIDRAFPHFVVALPLSYKVATVLPKNLFNLGGEIAHSGNFGSRR